MTYLKTLRVEWTLADFRSFAYKLIADIGSANRWALLRFTDPSESVMTCWEVAAFPCGRTGKRVWSSFRPDREAGATVSSIGTSGGGTPTKWQEFRNLLVTVVLPFSDLRSLIHPEFRRLPRPNWPSPHEGHLRGIGSVRRRNLPGFDGWICESSLVVGLPGFKLRLPRTIPGEPKQRLSLVRKACYFDGIVTGRFEFLFRIESDPTSISQLSSIISSLVDINLYIDFGKYGSGSQTKLIRAGPVGASIWAKATVSVKHQPEIHGVKFGRPIVFSELNTRIGKVDKNSIAGSAIIVNKNSQTFEHIAIYPSQNIHKKDTSFRHVSRFLRTYVLRILLNIESLSKICENSELNIDSDNLQLVFNEYTRHIIRSKIHVENNTELIDYCYSSFSRLFPGNMQTIRSKILSSVMRPNIKRKVLEFIDRVSQSNPENSHFYFVEGDCIMGDKFEDINVSGNGVAIGRGASAFATNVGNTQLHGLADDLRRLAAAVRASAHEESDVEAVLLEKAADSAQQGNEAGIMQYLKKSASWVFDLAKGIGVAALEELLKSKLGI